MATRTQVDYYEILGVERTASDRRDQVRLPQARPQVPSRPQPRQQGSRGELQGGGRGLQRAVRRRQAAALRRLRPRRARAARPASIPSIFSDFGDILGRPLRLRRRFRPPARRPAARRRPPLQPRARASRRRRSGPRRTIQIPRADGLRRPATGSGAAAGHAAHHLHRLRAARARSRSSRASSASPAPAAAAAAPGRMVTTPCKDCKRPGAGRPVERKLQIKIPAGVDTGSQLRISGRGRAGHAGRPPGRPLRRRPRRGARLLQARRHVASCARCRSASPRRRSARPLEVPTARRRQGEARHPRGHAERRQPSASAARACPTSERAAAATSTWSCAWWCPRKLTAEQRKLMEQLGEVAARRPRPQEKDRSFLDKMKDILS